MFPNVDFIVGKTNDVENKKLINTLKDKYEIVRDKNDAATWTFVLVIKIQKYSNVE